MGSGIKVAVDYQSVFGKKTGIGVFAENLFEAIRNESPKITFLFYGLKRAADLRMPERMIWESLLIPIRAAVDRPDLVYSPGFAPALVSPVRQVVTVHDIIGVTHPQNQKGPSRFYWKHWLPFALKKAHRLVVSSESTRRDLERHLGISPDRVDLVYLSANPIYRKDGAISVPRVLADRLRGRRYYLTVGALEPRKNLLRLCMAYESLLRRNRADFCLVIAGKPAGGEKEIVEFIAEKKLQEHVLIAGYLGLEDLVALCNRSIGYAIVSLYEGFGFPVLEAMQCGKSGVVSNRSSLPEIAGDTGIPVDPERVDEIADALSRLASDDALRASLEVAALSRAREFTPQKTARQMIRIFEQSVG